MINHKITLLAIAATALAIPAAAQQQSTTDILMMVITVIALASIIYTYHLTQTEKGLEHKAAELKKIIDKQRAEISQNQTLLAQQSRQLSKDVDSRVEDEIRKAEKLAQPKKQNTDPIRMEYWGKIEKMSAPASSINTQKMLVEKKDLETLIEITKKKYLERELDEKAFGEIIGGYQRRLIEIESKLGKQA